jgi:ligand-binding sensor domain-containing protein
MKQFLIATLLLTAGSLMAGPGDYVIKQYGSEEDFHGIFIYTITQDHDGFIWVGSDDGLYRFDGVELINFSARDSAVSELVTASMVSADGHLYFGYFKGGVDKMVHGKHQSVYHAEDIGGKVVGLRHDKNQTLWTATQNNGLVRIDTSGRALRYPIDALEGTIVYTMEILDTWMLLGTSSGFLILSISPASELTYRGKLSEIGDTPVLSMLADSRRNRLWAGTDGKGVFGFSYQTDLQQALSSSVSEVHLLPGTTVTAVGEDDLGDIWVGTKSNGLIEIDLNEDNIRDVQYTYLNESNGFIGNEISTVFVDRENEVWVGSFGHGFAQLNRAEFHHYELTRRLKIDNIKGFAQRDDKSLVIGTSGGLVRAFNPSSKDTLVFEPLAVNGFARPAVNHLYRSVNGTVWVGTQHEGLFVSSDDLETLRHVDLGKLDGPGVSIRFIGAAGGEDIWVSVEGNGLLKLDSSGHVKEQYNTRNGFYHNEIFYAYTDNQNNTWVAAHSNGLAVIGSDGQVRYPTQAGEFPYRDINSITAGTGGGIWIATFGAGLFRYEDGKYAHLGKEDGLLSDYCNSVAHDLKGNIWISHREGISYLDVETGIIRTFNHKRELGETEIVINSVFLDDLGNLWFGNPYGVTKVILPHINLLKKPSDTHITDIRLFYKEQDLLQFSSQDFLDDILPNDLTFPFWMNHLTFDFVAINMRNPGGVFYRYKLHGFEEDWSPVVRSNEATYTNLDPGDYEFIIQETYNPLYWPENYSSVQFSIRTPYWGRWWFYLGEVFFVATVLWATSFFVKRMQSRLLTKLMIYTAVFIMFEFVHSQLEPVFEKYTGEIPFLQVFMHLGLALLLFPIENAVTFYFERKRKRALVSHSGKTTPETSK